jgi:hypothetical protein
VDWIEVCFDQFLGAFDIRFSKSVALRVVRGRRNMVNAVLMADLDERVSELRTSIREDRHRIPEPVEDACHVSPDGFSCGFFAKFEDLWPPAVLVCHDQELPSEQAAQICVHELKRESGRWVRSQLFGSL